MLIDQISLLVPVSQVFHITKSLTLTSSNPLLRWCNLICRKPHETFILDRVNKLWNQTSFNSWLSYTHACWSAWTEHELAFLKRLFDGVVLHHVCLWLAAGLTSAGCFPSRNQVRVDRRWARPALRRWVPIDEVLYHQESSPWILHRYDGRLWGCINYLNNF